jgi:hypothetical protein
MATQRSKTQLGEQRGFLMRSVAAFKDGHEEEALRVATTIRVLVHETGNCRPLLKSIRPDFLNLAILDVHHPEPRGNFLFLYRVGFEIGGGGVKPITDTSQMQLSTIGKWWEKLCLVFTEEGARLEYRRRDLLLTLADKEGGAHVDPSLPAKYQQYVVDSGVKVVVGGVETDTIHLARFAAIQAGVQMIDCLDRILG